MIPASTPEEHPLRPYEPVVVGERVVAATEDGSTTVRDVSIEFGPLSWTQRVINNRGGGFPGAMAVATRPGDGAVLFIRTYRHTVRRHMWELPSGRSECADPIANARRELIEETGYTPATAGVFLGHPISLLGSVGGVFGVTWFEIADDAEPAAIDQEASAVVWFTRDTIARMVTDGTLRCAASLCSLALLDAHLRVAEQARSGLTVAA